MRHAELDETFLGDLHGSECLVVERELALLVVLRIVQPQRAAAVTASVSNQRYSDRDACWSSAP